MNSLFNVGNAHTKRPRLPLSVVALVGGVLSSASRDSRGAPHMRLGLDVRVTLTAFALGASVGCGASGDPLGGPYGGTTQLPPASDEGGNVAPTDLSSSGSGSGGQNPLDPSNSSSGSSGSSASGSSSGSSGSSSSGGNASTSSSGGSSSSSSGLGGSSSSGTGSSGSSSGVHSSGSSSSSGASSSSSSGGGTAPTWTQIYTSYFAPGTPGNCTNCHPGTNSPKCMYSYLQGRGQLGGSSPSLTSPTSSCLSWYGGNMPPLGPQNAQAVSQMNAWAAAGAMNN